MGKTRKQSDEERLAKKRLAEKKRQERIKNNPKLLLQEKLKRHLKYENQKKRGIVKSVNDMTSRGKRAIRKKWRDNSKRYRFNKKQNTNEIPDTPPESEEGNFQVDPGPSNCIDPTSDGRKLSGRNKVRRDGSKAYLHIKKLESELKKEKRFKEKYKRKYYRMKEVNKPKTNEDLTPQSKTNKLLKGFSVPNEVRRKILFGNVMEYQLADTYKALKDSKSKQIFTKVLAGKIIKKYRCLNQSRSFLKYKNFIANENRRKLVY